MLELCLTQQDFEGNWSCVRTAAEFNNDAPRYAVSAYSKNSLGETEWLKDVVGLNYGEASAIIKALSKAQEGGAK